MPGPVPHDPRLQAVTGLGLAIVQSIMLHSGKVEIASQLGQGTRVRLHVPIAEQGHAAALPYRHITKNVIFASSGCADLHTTLASLSSITFATDQLKTLGSTNLS